MTANSATSALALSPARVHALTAAVLSAFEAELAELVTAFDGETGASGIVAARDGVATLAEKARKDASPEHAAEEAELVAALRASTQGRDRFERLLSAHLVLGFAEDTLRHHVGWLSELVEGDAESVESLSALLGWQVPQFELVAALQDCFAEDDLVDDRLAMWGRRIAGDSAVWALTTCGIAPGTPASKVAEGADEPVEEFLRELFAQHSRRMNTLALAA